ncbi:hypothetical protein ACFYXW_11230 [Streptomyces sp. NPDC001981]|uniref:hypothetical protein n=1 Tax=Streptomyces sp. NPDC001981 TaxID=3364628 RepID=UPI0036A94E57
MPSLARRSMQVLSELGELAWFKLTSERHPLYGYQQLPFLGWRFKSPQEGVAEVIQTEVNATRTQVDWTLVTSERNWYLTPSRLVSEVESRGNGKFHEIMYEIAVDDQEFCVNALADLEGIVHRLESRSRTIPKSGSSE